MVWLSSWTAKEPGLNSLVLKKTALGYIWLILTCLLPTQRGFKFVLKQRGKKAFTYEKAQTYIILLPYSAASLEECAIRHEGCYRNLPMQITSVTTGWLARCSQGEAKVEKNLCWFLNWSDTVSSMLEDSFQAFTEDYGITIETRICLNGFPTNTKLLMEQVLIPELFNAE